MTAQITDTIIINDNEYAIYDFPLEQYWKQAKNKLLLFSLTTSLNRGYYAKWLIEKKNLFLIDFYGEFALAGKKYQLSDLFPSSAEKIFAKWYTGDITIPMGEQLSYFHGGFGAIFEYSTTIKLCDGLVIDPGLFLIE